MVFTTTTKVGFDQTEGKTFFSKFSDEIISFVQKNFEVEKESYDILTLGTELKMFGINLKIF